MIDFGSRRIFVSNCPVDMRKSFDTLATYVQGHLGADPLSGDAFVFIGKRHNRLKVLIWEPSGYWVLNKRLAQGTFRFNASAGALATALSSAQWHMLLEGIVLKKSRQLKRYKTNRTL
jgi:transposase